LITQILTTAAYAGHNKLYTTHTHTHNTHTHSHTLTGATQDGVVYTAANICSNPMVVITDTLMVCQMSVPTGGLVVPVLTGAPAGGANPLAAFTITYSPVAKLRPTLDRVEVSCGECVTLRNGGMANCPPSGKSLEANGDITLTFVGSDFDEGSTVSEVRLLFCVSCV
jgi:hypothetical protein